MLDEVEVEILIDSVYQTELQILDDDDIDDIGKLDDSEMQHTIDEVEVDEVRLVAMLIDDSNEYLSCVIIRLLLNDVILLEVQNILVDHTQFISLRAIEV